MVWGVAVTILSIAYLIVFLNNMLVNELTRYNAADSLKDKQHRLTKHILDKNTDKYLIFKKLSLTQTRDLSVV